MQSRHTLRPTNFVKSPSTIPYMDRIKFPTPFALSLFHDRVVCVVRRVMQQSFN